MIMESGKYLFSDFPAVTKQEWLAKIEKDLKGRSLESLEWHLGNDLAVSPFAHADDMKGEYSAPIRTDSGTNEWNIGADISVEKGNFKQANAAALSALNAGASSPLFIFGDYPTSTELNVLLDGIRLDYIFARFSSSSRTASPLPFLQRLYRFAKKQGLEPGLLKGAVYYDMLLVENAGDLESAAKLLEWTSTHMPHFAVFVIECPETRGSSFAPQALCGLLKRMDTYFSKLTGHGIKAETVAAHIQFALPVGTGYFVEIAKIRALHLLWGNLLATCGLPARRAVIHANAGIETQIADANQNKIRMTTQAMSAAIGGVQSITLAPSDAFMGSGYISDFNRRIAINVQHLLQMETYLDRVADPGAGSYYIERLTNQLGKYAWENR